MSTVIVSYSLTGNNRKLAVAVAAAFSAEHIEITTTKSQTTGTIILDMMFNRTPQVRPEPTFLAKHERILFLAPVWMGKVASPLRAYLKHLKAHPQSYAFASISGGALNPNPKLEADITKRAGAKPMAFLDLHISDLLGAGAKQKMKETGDYLLTDGDVAKLIRQLADSPVGRWCHYEQ